MRSRERAWNRRYMRWGDSEEMSESSNNTGSGRPKGAFGKPVVRYALLAVVAVVAMLGIIGGFTTTVESTNSLEFCTSCHDMSYNYEEYKKTIHYKNPAGVRAVCSDCHVPKKGWFSEMRRKVIAAQDVWAEITGTIDTREKFDAHRLDMAKREWERMKESD